MFEFVPPYKGNERQWEWDDRLLQFHRSQNSNEPKSIDGK